MTPTPKLPRWIWVVYGVTVVLVTLQKGLMHPGNFLLFRCTFERLIHGQQLYIDHPGCSGFLYSPAFAFWFGPFALLGPLLGLFCWNALNGAAPVLALSRLLDPRQARWVLVFIYLDVVRSLQNSQSNALIAGLLVAAFVASEGQHVLGAAVATAAGALIKIFPAAAALFALIPPLTPRERLRRAAVFVVVGAVLALAPMLVTSPALWLAHYGAWLGRTSTTSVLRGESLLGILATWFRFSGPNWPVQLIGLLVLLAPATARRRLAGDARFRRLFLCSLLVFVVIFNHQAESPSYVIATTGIGIWAVTEAGVWRVSLALLTLVLVSLVATSLVPWHYRHDLLRAYSLQAVPCVLSWAGMQWDLWTASPTGRQSASDGTLPAAAP